MRRHKLWTIIGVVVLLLTVTAVAGCVSQSEYEALQAESAVLIGENASLSAELDAMQAASATYFAEAIPGGRFHGWLAVTSAGEVVSTGGVILDQHIPTPGNLSGKIGYILNIVTVPSRRRRGIARRVLQTILAWLAEQGIQRVELHTSDDGRSLYESLGFEPTTHEMRLEIGK